MKKLYSVKRRGGLVLLALLCSMGLGGCDDAHVELDVPPSYASDPNSKVSFTSFTPTEGGVRTTMFIYGDNFGTDPDLIDVKIGGQTAKVIRANNKEIYCIVPARADQGYVEVTIWDAAHENSVSHSFDQRFTYIYNTVVGTLCGVVDSEGNAAYKDGTFEEAGFTQPGLIYTDPTDPDVLYLFEQSASQLRRINIADETVESLISTASGWNQVNSIAWSVTADTMFVNNNQTSDDGPAMFILKREEDFKVAHLVMRGKDCNCVFTDPLEGTLFCVIGTNAKIHRPEWNESTLMYELGDYVASIAANGQWFQSITFVPTGDYIMGTSRQNHYVFKATYDREGKRPTNPLPFAGSGAGYGEGVGLGNFFDSPRQGVFVYNEEYAASGAAPEECYDYYIAGSTNHCIHKVTPVGAVSTYAGRGSVSTTGNVAGYIDGDLRNEAQFNWPEGITYIEARKTFYISDAGNHRIRTITIQ